MWLLNSTATAGRSVQELRREVAEGAGKVGVVAELRAVQQTGRDVELSPAAVGGVKDGEVFAHFPRESGDGEAVAVERGRVGADGSAAPEFPVQDAEGVEEVRPVEVAVDGLPALDPDLDLGAEAACTRRSTFSWSVLTRGVGAEARFRRASRRPFHQSSDGSIPGPAVSVGEQGVP